MEMREIEKVCVFCASSSMVDNVYLKDAELMGLEFVKNNIHVVYGGGAVGLMGILADTIIANSGKITGIIPEFMTHLEWAHQGIDELIEVKSMYERKNLMINGVDAIIALPGGIGTLEELTEVITLKQLRQFLVPIIILNTNGYYNSLIDFFDQMVLENFMSPHHKNIWEVVKKPSEVIPAIHKSKPWE